MPLITEVNTAFNIVQNELPNTNKDAFPQNRPWQIQQKSNT